MKLQARPYRVEILKPDKSTRHAVLSARVEDLGEEQRLQEDFRSGRTPRNFRFRITPKTSAIRTGDYIVLSFDSKQYRVTEIEQDRETAEYVILGIAGK